jgi:hypothetical protein
MAAAVADFRPVTVADHKIKKADGSPEIRLEPTVDILAALGAAKVPGQTLVGFAAETTDVAAHARAKLTPRTSTYWWPTTCRRPASASSTTPTRSSSTAAGAETSRYR